MKMVYVQKSKTYPDQDEDAADEEGVGADRGGHGGDDGGSAVLTHHQTGHVTVHTRHSVLRHTGMRYYHCCNTAPDRVRHGKHTSLRSDRARHGKHTSLRSDRVRHGKHTSLQSLTRHKTGCVMVNTRHSNL